VRVRLLQVELRWLPAEKNMVVAIQMLFLTKSDSFDKAIRVVIRLDGSSESCMILIKTARINSLSFLSLSLFLSLISLSFSLSFFCLLPLFSSFFFPDFPFRSLFKSLIFAHAPRIIFLSHFIQTSEKKKPRN